MNERKRTKKSLLETLNVLEKCNFKRIILKVFIGSIKDVIKYSKSNYDDEETRGVIVYQFDFPSALIEVGI